MCGAERPRFGFKDALSESFWTVGQMSRMFPFAEGPIVLCEACVWSAKSLALRCACWLVTERGYWWIPRSGLLAILLDPPPPPFAIGFPAYGIAHGGETHAWRATWCGRVHEEPLVRLQAKHCAIYAEVATSRDRYPLQVDDGAAVWVDRPRWARLVAELAPVVAELRAAGVGATDLRASLLSLSPPPRTPMVMLARWSQLVAPYRAHARAIWWRTLVELLPIPPLPEKPARAAKASPKPAPPAAPQPAQGSLL
jgi:hypothetical protein